MNTSVTENGIFNEQFRFSTVDYGVFGLMLLVSAVTGLYHGLSGRKKLTTRKYLMGNNMQVFPVAMSLIASYVSGVTILGTPAEIYNFGTQYWLIVLAIWFMGLMVSQVYLPVFARLKVNSSYEYLQLRFDSRIRTLASVMFIMDEVMFLPILVYVPALAFNQVTGVSIHIIGSIVCIICIFYTVIGGLKAVVWTDTLQIIVMFISVVVIVVLGTISLGGPLEIFDKARQGGRIIFFNWDPSLYERHTVWSVVIGGTFYWTAFNAVNQTMVQRYLSLATLRDSRRSLFLFTAGVSVFVSLCCWAGLLVYAAYGDCDPRTAGLVLADDQLLPRFVLASAGHLAGLPGLFIAGVFGAALSSLSVVLHSTAAVILQDVLKGVAGVNLKDHTATAVVKACVALLGVMALGCLFIVEHLGGVLSVATSLSAIAAGTTFGIFTLGMLVPFATANGALIGALFGALASGWISFGSQWASATGLIHPHTLPLSVSECPVNVTLVVPSHEDEDQVFGLYRLSYHWITPVGVCTVVLVGIVASLLFPSSKCVEEELLSPVVLWFKRKQYDVSRTSSVINLKETQETIFVTST